MSEYAEGVVLVAAMVALAAAIAAWLAVAKFQRLVIKFMAGPPAAAAKDMVDALGERRSGERHWTAGGR